MESKLVYQDDWPTQEGISSKQSEYLESPLFKKLTPPSGTSKKWLIIQQQKICLWSTCIQYTLDKRLAEKLNK